MTFVLNIEQNMASFAFTEAYNSSAITFMPLLYGMRYKISYRFVDILVCFYAILLNKLFAGA